MRQTAPSAAAPRRAGRPARSGTRDAFVLCAMAVVVVALGLGLHLHLQVNGQAALITALVVWMALLVMHVAVRRAHAVAAAMPDAAHDAKEPLDLKRMSATAAAPAETPRRTRPTISEEAPARPKPPPLPPSALAPAARPGAPVQEGLRGLADVQPPRSLPELHSSDAPSEERRLPPEMGWDLRPGVRQELPVSTGPRPAVFPPLEPSMPAAPGHKDAVPAPPRFGRQPPSLDESSKAQSRPAPSLGAPFAQPRTPTPADQPVPTPGGAAVDARTTELRSMQSIIDQLARQLKAPLGSEAGSAPEPQVGTEQAIARSVEALKAAGGAMRATQDGVHAGPAARAETAAAAHVSAPHTGAPPIVDALASDNLEICLDSILGLEDRKTRHFEISARIRTAMNEPVTIDDYSLVQAGDGLRGRLDAAKLMRVARIAEPLSKRGLSASLFVNLAAESLIDDTFLDACANALKTQPGIVHQIVPSFSQGEIRSFSKPHWETLATLKENGIRFGLERLADLAMDFAILRERGFQFVKIDAGVLLSGMQAHDGVVSALQVCRRVAEAGLDLIVGRIDDDATLAQVGGLGVLYGQGTFFGVPRPVKIDPKAPHEAAA